MIVTVVGNYPKIPNRPRPARLRNALNRLDRGEITREELAAVQDQVTVEVLKEQVEAGVELLTDGQIRWEDEVTYIAGRLKGVQLNGLTRFFDTNTYYREPVVEGAASWAKPITVADYQFAVARSPRPVKPVLTGPYTLARLSRDQHYGSLPDFCLALAGALNAEARALQAAGATLIQFNEPAATNHPEDAALLQKAWRRLLEGLSAETAVYFYFGSPDGCLAPALESGFATVGIDATLPGALDVLRKEGRPEKLAVGVVDSRTTRLESVDHVVSRIKDAASLFPLDRLYVNPNMGLEFLPREQAQAKLARLAEAAAAARKVLA